jgi:hypothetical protein
MFLGLSHPVRDLVGIVASGTQAAFEALHRRRKDEDADNIAWQLDLQAPMALPVENQDHVLPVRNSLNDRRSRCAISALEDLSGFQHLAGGCQELEFIGRREVVALAVHLTGPR